LKGLEAAEIPYSSLNEQARIDPEYFKKRYLREDAERERFSNHPLGTQAFITDGQHGYHVVDETSPISMLTAKNARGWFATTEDADPIADWVHQNNQRSSLEKDDLIISTRGTVGLCALVTPESLPANIDQDVARVAFNQDSVFNPYFVLAYLNSAFGQDWLNRNATGMVQQGVSLEKLRLLPLPQLSIRFQEEVRDAVKSALRKNVSSRYAYAQAEALLLRELGLEGWQPPEPLAYESTFSQAWGDGRLDAEHFQPKYAAMLERVKQVAPRCRNVADFATFCDRGAQPLYSEEGTLAVVNSRHILENGLDYDNFERAHASQWNHTNFVSARIERGDVLTYMTGANVGRTAVYLSDEQALASNEVNILRTNQENPVYVAAVINSMVGRMQTRGSVTGSAQAHLYPSDIKKFLIPFVSDDVQQQIVQAIETAHQARRQSKQLLEAAKRAVEMAIEDSEDAALALLTQATTEPE